MTIGITGGIGAGKSVVSRVLRCNGFVVYDCDSEAKYLMVTDNSLKESLTKRLGKGIYLNNGELNKEKLADLIFNDSDIRNFVNGKVHTAVRNDILNKAKFLKEFFIESAILATGGIAPYCEQIWVVTAPLEERISRVIRRDKTSTEEIERRILSQKKELELLKNEPVITLDNDNHHSLLKVILQLTKKFNNNQTYTIPC